MPHTSIDPYTLPEHVAIRSTEYGSTVQYYNMCPLRSVNYLSSKSRLPKDSPRARPGLNNLTWLIHVLRIRMISDDSFVPEVSDEPWSGSQIRSEITREVFQVEKNAMLIRFMKLHFHSI